MRFMTGAVIVGSLILVVILAIYLRIQPPAETAPAPAVRKPPVVSGQGGTGRVESRLSHLRADYEQRRAALRRPEASQPELPPRDDAPVAPASNTDLADLEEWRSVALTDPDPDERSGAILMLSGEEDPETLDVLVRAMNDSDAEVRLAAVEALGDFAEELNPDVLLPALQDPDPEVRFEAVGILGDLESPEALDLVRDSLDDPDEDVRSLAEGIIELAEPRPKTMRDVRSMIHERDGTGSPMRRWGQKKWYGTGRR